MTPVCKMGAPGPGPGPGPRGSRVLVLLMRILAESGSSTIVMREKFLCLV